MTFQLYKSGSVSQPEIIHSNQSCKLYRSLISWMTNNQLQLQRRFSTLTVPQSINLEDSNIKLANTVRNIGVCLDPTLSFQQQISSIGDICYLEFCQISAIRHYLSEDVATKKLFCASVVLRLDYCNSLLAGCPKYLLSIILNSKGYRTMLQDSFSEQPDLPTSLLRVLCFILLLATYWAED